MPKLNSTEEKTMRELSVEEMELAAGGGEPVIIDFEKFDPFSGV